MSKQILSNYQTHGRIADGYLSHLTSCHTTGHSPTSICARNTWPQIDVTIWAAGQLHCDEVVAIQKLCNSTTALVPDRTPCWRHISARQLRMIWLHLEFVGRWMMNEIVVTNSIIKGLLRTRYSDSHGHQNFVRTKLYEIAKNNRTRNSEWWNKLWNKLWNKSF